MEGPLHGLEVGGWHRIHLILDGEEIGVSKPIFVVGPRKTPRRYMGRNALLPIDAGRRPEVRPAPETLTGLEILVIENDDDSREALGTWLDHLGGRVSTARDGR